MHFVTLISSAQQTRTKLNSLLGSSLLTVTQPSIPSKYSNFYPDEPTTERASHRNHLLAVTTNGLDTVFTTKQKTTESSFS